MSAPLERTATPGIYRRGSRYVVTFRDPSGRQRRQSVPTLAAARALKAEKKADIVRGEYRTDSAVTFADYAAEWIEGYQGRTSRGFKETTRDDYRKALARAVEFFGPRKKLAEIEPRNLRDLAAHVAATGVSASTVRNMLAPVKALLATAVEDGLLRANPASGVRVVVPTSEEPEKGKALSDEDLDRLLREIPNEWRPFFTFLAETGLRIGEAVALQWQDVDFARRRVSVRRRLYRGEYAPPKSRYGWRDVPITRAMAQALAARWNETRPRPEAPVWPSRRGAVLAPSNLMGRVLKPAARRAGLAWVGFHTFRHTAATGAFRKGWNVVQVQRLLGHHKASFTLDTYVHAHAAELAESPFEEQAVEPVEEGPVEAAA